MADLKAIKLFKEILLLTKQGRIPWEPAVSGETLLAAIKGKNSLVLLPYTDHDSYGHEHGWPSLIVRDASDRDLLTVTGSMDGATPQELQELYDTARRQALKVDDQVEDLLMDLKNL